MKISKILEVYEDGKGSYVHAADCSCKAAEKLRWGVEADRVDVFEVDHGNMQQVLEQIWEDCREDFTDAEWADHPGREGVMFSRCAQVKREDKKPASNSDHPEWDKERLPGCDDETYQQAVKVREGREAKKAWWQIAHEMKLKGHGANATQGKTGAAAARRLWERAWGRTYQSTEAARETAARKRERVISAPGKPRFSSENSDNEIISAVQSRHITWHTRIGGSPGTALVSEQNAMVAPKGVKVVRGPKGRVLEFYEWLDSTNQKLRTFGPRRSVYIDRIEKVK